MKHYIGDDAHKKYSVFSIVNEKGVMSSCERVPHDKETYRKYLSTLPENSPIAIESVGNWYWMVEAMEQAGHTPILVHPRKAKLMMGRINKTDKLDARGLAMLGLNGSLPEVWIPPAEIRDQRELSRMRMALVSVRTKFKNRIHATLAKYAIVIDEVSDVFGVKGRELLKESIKELPFETRQSVEEQLILREGTIVDATIISAPSSTKNRDNARDNEMHSTKKGNQWYFGMKAHIGTDTGKGLVHSVVVTNAQFTIHKSWISYCTAKSKLYTGIAPIPVRKGEQNMKEKASSGASIVKATDIIN